MRTMSRRKAISCLGGLASLSIAPSSTFAADKQLRIAYQPGLNSLPLMVLEHEKLVEAQLSDAGKQADVSWLRFTAGGPMNDAILAGQIDIASGGISVLAVLWDKTRGRQNVQGVTALSSSPFFLNVNRASIGSLADFTETDRIAVPMAKIS